MSDREAAIRYLRSEANRRNWPRLDECAGVLEAELAACNDLRDTAVRKWREAEEREAKLRQALRPFTNYDLHAVHWRDKIHRLVPHTVIAEWIKLIDNARAALADGEGET